MGSTGNWSYKGHYIETVLGVIDRNTQGLGFREIVFDVACGCSLSVHPPCSPLSHSDLHAKVFSDNPHPIITRGA